MATTAEAAMISGYIPEKQIPILPSIDLRKRIVQFTLEKKELTGVTARVGIVLDITGSMRNLYNNGTVQEVVERLKGRLIHVVI
ncbi:arginyl-tRNA synthetase [Paenibacillus wynnii]|nr:arginyl-tRNA synthetase [Paenibacillus wynnii]